MGRQHFQVHGGSLIALLLTNWKLVLIGLLMAAVSFFYWRAGVWEKKYYTFVAETKAVGEAQERATAAKTLADKLAKDTADATHTVAVNSLNATIKRLRLEHAGSSLVPTSAPGASRPELACFDRPELVGALRRFEEGVEAIAGEGDAATVGLNTARKWAHP